MTRKIRKIVYINNILNFQIQQKYINLEEDIQSSNIVRPFIIWRAGPNSA